MKYQLLTSVLIASIASKPIESVHKYLFEVSNSNDFEEGFENFGSAGEDYSDSLDTESQPWKGEYFDDQQGLNFDDYFGSPVEDSSDNIGEFSQLDQDDNFGGPIDDGYSEFGMSQLSEEDGFDYSDINSSTLSQNFENLSSNTEDILSNPDSFDDLMEYGNLDTDTLNQMAEINDAMELEAMNNRQAQLDQEQGLDNEDIDSSTMSQNFDNFGSNDEDILSNPDSFDDLMEYGNLDADTLNQMAEINDAMELEDMHNKQSQLDQEQGLDEQNNLDYEENMNTDTTGEESISDLGDSSELIKEKGSLPSDSLEESNTVDQPNKSELSIDSQSSEANKETQLTNTKDDPTDNKPDTDNNPSEDKKENLSPSTENKPGDENPSTDAKLDKEEVMDPLKAKAKEWWETGANFFQSFWK
jgi:hypothetical protein